MLVNENLQTSTQCYAPFSCTCSFRWPLFQFRLSGHACST